MLSEPPHRTTSDSFRQISCKSIKQQLFLSMNKTKKRHYKCFNVSLKAPVAAHSYKYAQTSSPQIELAPAGYLSAIDDGLEPRSTQPVDGECRHWDGNATPQTHMAGNVWRVG